jgi:hypothetical protein
VVVVTSKIGTDSYISLPKKGYVTSFGPESTCFYVAASRRSMNKRYIMIPFPAGQGSPLLLGATLDYLLVGQGLYRDPNSMTIKILITPPSDQP